MTFKVRFAPSIDLNQLFFFMANGTMSKHHLTVPLIGSTLPDS